MVLPTTMTAIRAHRRGGPEVLHLEEAPVPVPADDEVLIEVRAAAITYAELTWDETWTRDGRDRTPIIPSHEYAGVVVLAGAGVRDLAVGDDVFGLIPFDRDGAAARYVAVAADHVARMPPGIDYPDAASVALAALTAWQALVDQAQLRSGQRVLVAGGAGGVGSYGVQLARHLGGQVTASVRDVGQQEFARSLGAGRVVIGDPPTAEKFDVVLDAQGGPTTPTLYDAVADHGRLVTLSAPPSVELGSVRGIRSIFFIVTPDRHELEQLAALVVQGALRPMIGTTLPLSSAPDAYAGRGLTGRPGKTVLVIDAG